MNEHISILGTGWLGLPLANALLADGYHIKGATTSTSKLKMLEDVGIIPFCITLTEKGPEGDIINFLNGSTTLIINIPPGLRKNPESSFVAKIKNVLPYIEKSTVEKVLFVSSTGVFSDQETFPTITLDTAPNATNNSGKQLIEVEKMLQNNSNFKTTIIRFAGLFDVRRHPAKMLSKKTGIKNPLAPVNLIHREDCIGIIQHILKTKAWDQVFNASYPDHPEKAKYYTEICEKMGIPIPIYDFEATSKGKIIDSDLRSTYLAYTYKVAIFST